MKKIYLSPSNQTANRYAYGNTNECVQCTMIAGYVRDYLLANYECDAIIAQQMDNMNERCSEAKAFGADIYIAIHTNAFNKTVRGTETYYHSDDVEGKKFASVLLDKVSELTECKRRTKSYDSLIELNTPICTRAYIEVDFHSNPDRAKWIIENSKVIGETIASTIAEYFELLKRSDAQKVYIINAISTELTAQQAEKEKTELETAGYKVTLTEQIKAIENDTKEDKIVLNIGDRVKLTENAVIYGTERKFLAFIYKKKLYVRDINGDRVIISTVPMGPITGAVDKKYLIKID